MQLTFMESYAAFAQFFTIAPTVLPKTENAELMRFDRTPPVEESTVV